MPPPAFLAFSRLLDEATAFTHAVRALGAEFRQDNGLGGWEDTATLRQLLAGPQAVGQLAHDRHVSRPALSAIVARLESLGYVSRSDNPDHAQSRLVSLTPEGERVARHSLEIGSCVCGNLAREIPQEECDRAASVLRRARRALEACR